MNIIYRLRRRYVQFRFPFLTNSKNLNWSLELMGILTSICFIDNSLSLSMEQWSQNPWGRPTNTVPYLELCPWLVIWRGRAIRLPVLWDSAQHRSVLTYSLCCLPAQLVPTQAKPNLFQWPCEPKLNNHTKQFILLCASGNARVISSFTYGFYSYLGGRAARDWLENREEKGDLCVVCTLISNSVPSIFLCHFLLYTKDYLNTCILKIDPL